MSATRVIFSDLIFKLIHRLPRYEYLLLRFPIAYVLYQPLEIHGIQTSQLLVKEIKNEHCRIIYIYLCNNYHRLNFINKKCSNSIQQSSKALSELFYFIYLLRSLRHFALSGTLF